MDTGTLRLLFLLILLFLAGGIYSFVSSIFTKNKWVRFLPTLLSLLLIPYLLYQTYFGNLEGFMPLAYLLFIFMLAAVVFGNLVGNLIFRKLPDKRTRS